MRKKEEKLVVTFHTTAGAIAMEKLCGELGLPGKLISVPRSLTSDCGLAWCAELSLRPAIEQALEGKDMDLEGIYQVPV